MEDNQLLIQIAGDSNSLGASFNADSFPVTKDDMAMNCQEHNQESTLFFQSDSKRRPFHIAVIGALAVFIAVGLLLVSSILYGLTGGNIPFDYGIVIDGGSTHTEVFLYEWLGNKDHGTGDVLQEDSCTFDGGIASLPDPTVILTCVTNITNSVPKHVQPNTPLYMGATAGMRLLKLAEPGQANLILLALRYALQQTHVDVKMVDIIEGYDEGTFSWITVNFLLKTFNIQMANWFFNQENDLWKTTYGALDMGGASTQIAYAIDPAFVENKTHVSRLKLYGLEYQVVSKSFLCFGMMQAYNRHQALLIKDLNSSANVIDPCLPKGNFSTLKAGILLGGPCTQNPTFENWLEIKNHRNKEFVFEGSSDFNSCKKSVEELLDAKSCLAMDFKNCPEKFDIPSTGMKYMAFSSFYYMTSFLNSTNAPLHEFMGNAENWCKLTWNEIKKHEYKKSDLSHLTQYCFGALYMINWLMNIYGFNESSWNNITFQQQIDGSDVGWSLGYMINATNAIPEELPSPPVMPTIAFVILAVCSVPIALIGIAFLCQYFKTGYRYSQLRHKRFIES